MPLHLACAFVCVVLAQVIIASCHAVLLVVNACTFSCFSTYTLLRGE